MGMRRHPSPALLQSNRESVAGEVNYSRVDVSPLVPIKRPVLFLGHVNVAFATSHMMGGSSILHKSVRSRRVLSAGNICLHNSRRRMQRNTSASEVDRME